VGGIHYFDDPGVSYFRRTAVRDRALTLLAVIGVIVTAHWSTWGAMQNPEISNRICLPVIGRNFFSLAPYLFCGGCLVVG